MSTKDYSSKQETAIAKFLGWSVVSGSGSRACCPGDITSFDWLGECKTHLSPNTKITFYETVWHKICDEAASKFKYPVLFVDDGSQSIDHTWCVYPINAVSSADLIVRPYTRKFQRNISFYHSSLLQESQQIKLCEPTDSAGVVFATTFGGHRVGIATLRTFAAVFGGE